MYIESTEEKLAKISVYTCVSHVILFLFSYPCYELITLVYVIYIYIYIIVVQHKNIAGHLVSVMTINTDRRVNNNRANRKYLRIQLFNVGRS